MSRVWGRTSTQHKDYRNTRTIATQGLSQHKDYRNTWTIATQGLSQHKVYRNTRTIATQGLSQHKDYRNTRTIATQGLSQHKQGSIFCLIFSNLELTYTALCPFSVSYHSQAGSTRADPDNVIENRDQPVNIHHWSAVYFATEFHSNSNSNSNSNTVCEKTSLERKM